MQEAKDILQQCHRSGIMHTFIKCPQDFYAICNCCACCCVPLSLKEEYGIDNTLTRTHSIVREFKEHSLSQKK